MFGTLKPHTCSLPPAAKETQGRLYCGLCKALGDGYGQAYRGLLSHDAVFLAALVDALADEAAPPDTARCPLLPVHHRKTVAPTSLAMTFASGFQLLLAEQWLLDRALDGSPWLRATHGLVAGPAAVARERLAAIGADVTPLLGFEGRQKAAEVWGADPDDVAAPTADALAHVFRAVADVTGRPDAGEALGRLGSGVGRAIYLIDALEDLAKDARTGQFNACLDPGDSDDRDDRAPSAVRVGAARRSLSVALRDIAEALATLPLERHRDVLEATLLHRLPQRARLAARDARAALPGPASPERRAALGWAAAVWAWLLLWLPAPWAAAQDRPNKDRPRLDRPKPGDPPRPKPEPAPSPRPEEPEPEPEPEEPPTNAEPAPCCLDDGSCCDCGSSCNQDCERCCNDCESCCDCGSQCDLQRCCDDCCAENDDCCTGCSVQQGRLRQIRLRLW